MQCTKVLCTILRRSTILPTVFYIQSILRSGPSTLGPILRSVFLQSTLHHTIVLSVQPSSTSFALNLPLKYFFSVVFPAERSNPIARKVHLVKKKFFLSRQDFGMTEIQTRSRVS